MPDRTVPIANLIENLPVAVAAGDVAAPVTDIVDDSRRVKSGAMFIARRGHDQDGSQYIDDALDSGATAVLAAAPCQAPISLTADDPNAVGARIAERFHGHPSTHLRLVGITGTNGKTTTTHLLHHILNAAGKKAGLIGSIHCDDGAGLLRSSLTTPSACEFSRLLARMVDNDCTACIAETSSHALHQGRVAALQFVGGIFTNLSGDHLDYHKTTDAYAHAKSRLFQQVNPDGFIVANADDEHAHQVIQSPEATVHWCSQSLTDAEFTAELEQESLAGLRLVLRGPWDTINVLLPLVGRHNAMNALQAAAAAHMLGCTAEDILKGLATAPAPPGRLERVGTRQPVVFVDFAHTDDALASVLRSVRPLVPPDGLLRVVFGCGGDRDRTKRPRMGAIATQLADAVYITSDNPRTEDPATIIQDIESGIDRTTIRHVYSNADRSGAIQAAIAEAGASDVILIAGKGHETEQIIGDDRIPFDDRLIAADALESRSLETPVT